jgi:hypothetical protein
MPKLSRTLGLALALVATGCLGAGVTTAQAATPPRMQAMRVARRLFAQSLPGSLRTTMLEHAGTPVAPNTALLLDTDPAPLSVGGLSYQMELSAFTVTDSFGSPPQMDLALWRLSRQNGRVTGEQEHVYGYSSTDMTMTATTGLSRLQLNSHQSFPTTRVDTTFSPTTVESDRCRLSTGGRGTFSEAVGTLSAKRFRIGTGTSPFFGTITSEPQTAFALADPGCLTGGGAIITSGSRVRFSAPCSGRETIQYGSPFAATSLSAEVGFRGHNAYILAETGQSSVTTSVAHLAIGLEPASGMPAPAHSASGARAKLRTGQNPLFAGAARFVSTAAPSRSALHACTYERHIYHFRSLRYRGTLSPAGSPLQALFDTAPFPFAAGTATLVVRTFTR